MPAMLPRLRAIPVWLQLCLCLLLGMVLSLIDRTDANWDLQNYHLYDPWALLHGRLGADYFVAAYQSYFNPAADVPYYIVKYLLAPGAPRLAAMLAGLPYGLLVFFVVRLAARFVTGPHAAFFAAFAGVTGTATLSEVGTSFDDILVADFLLGAMLCLLAEGRRPAVAAGLLCGIGAALKLTAGLFAVPLGLMLVALPAQRRWTRLVLFGLATAAGFLAAYGWWGWLLWRHFGNPVYPLFSSFFPNVWAVPTNGQDTRFFPKTLLQWLAYPFFWLQGKPGIVAELPVRDPRFAFSYLAAAGAIAAMACRRRPDRRTLALWLFIVSGYIIWLRGFSILRYALPLEVLSGVFIATVLQTLWPGRRIALPLALLAAFCLAISEPMDWGHIGYDESLVSTPVPSLPPETLLLTQGGPVGFVLPSLSPAPPHIIALLCLRAGTPEWARLHTLLNRHPPVWLLTSDRATQASLMAARLSALGLRLTGNGCRPVRSAVQNTLELCPVSPATAAAPS